MADKLLAEWFWTDRWMGSSAFLLPLEARGLYREMLTQAWRRGASLPKEPEAIQRACGVTPDEWSRSWPKIAHYWRENGNSIYNETQRLVYKEAQERHEAYSERASKAAKARWGAERMPDAMLGQCPPSPSPSPNSVSDSLNPPMPPLGKGGRSRPRRQDKPRDEKADRDRFSVQATISALSRFTWHEGEMAEAIYRSRLLDRDLERTAKTSDSKTAFLAKAAPWMNGHD